MRQKIIFIVIGIAVIAATSVGPIMSNVEQAKYDIVETHGDIEIRDYAPMLVAETEVSGPREQAISQGFRIIADYIFGNNTAAQKVAMTAPVTQQANEKIAMTAPVMQQGEGKSWKVHFVMPAGYTLETLPKPNNDAVKLKKIAGKRFAVIRFSGMVKQDSLVEHAQLLEDFIDAHQRKALSAPAYAFFNPPWTLPFLRRNEVMVEIAK